MWYFFHNFYREWNAVHPRQAILEHHVFALYLTLFGQAILKHKKWHIGMKALKEALKLSNHPHALRVWTRFIFSTLSYVTEGIRKR